MRISPTELQAVRRAGMLTRFGLLGPVAFIMVELSESGTVGTGLDEACLTDHHGLVTRGWFAVHHADGRSETFKAGDAFYVPEGPPPHTFSGSPGCHVQGFAVVPADTDTSTEGLRALGFETADTPDPVGPPPTTVTLRGSVDPFHRTGAIEVEGSRMGPWLFMRARFGPRGGYTSGWCDLTHWGLVLEGEVAIQRSDSTELAGRGDVYHVEPGHRFTSPDGATIWVSASEWTPPSRPPLATPTTHAPFW